MQKRALFVIVIGIFVLASSYLAYTCGYSHGVATQAHGGKAVAEHLLFKDDFPLMEVMLDQDSRWTLILREHQSANNESFRMLTQTDAMALHREHLSLRTFPVGRGTTPSGCCYLYQNQHLVKEVPYVDVQFSNTAFERSFSIATRAKVQERIGGELPPLF